MYKNIKIFIDMDGVLAKWNTKATKEDTKKNGYFLSCEPEQIIISLINRLKKLGFDVSILSCVYPETNSATEKKTWLKKYDLFDIKHVFVPYGKNKANYVKNDNETLNVLIDDYSNNLHQWESQGENYRGIKFYNGINGANGTWANKWSINKYMTIDQMLLSIGFKLAEINL